MFPWLVLGGVAAYFGYALFHTSGKPAYSDPNLAMQNENMAATNAILSEMGAGCASAASIARFQRIANALTHAVATSNLPLSNEAAAYFPVRTDGVVDAGTAWFFHQYTGTDLRAC